MTPHFLIRSFGPKIGSVDGICHQTDSMNRLYLDVKTGPSGRKGQHGVGLAIKEEIVKKAGEDGIAIECISVRLLKARISIKSNFVTFVVSLRPDQGSAGGAEGQIHGSPELHHSISARSGIRLRFNRRERQDREER